MKVTVLGHEGDQQLCDNFFVRVFLRDYAAQSTGRDAKTIGHGVFMTSSSTDHPGNPILFGQYYDRDEETIGTSEHQIEILDGNGDGPTAYMLRDRTDPTVRDCLLFEGDFYCMAIRQLVYAHTAAITDMERP